MLKSVAPLTGSVDRNQHFGDVPHRGDGSLPSRGAWIEISSDKEAVCTLSRRSPHGERG